MTDDKLWQMQQLSKMRHNTLLCEREDLLEEKQGMDEKRKEVVSRIAEINETLTKEGVDFINFNKPNGLGDVLKNVLFFDGEFIPAVRALFTQSGKLRKYSNVPKIPDTADNLPKKAYTEKIRIAKKKQVEARPIYTSVIQRNISRMPELPDQSIKNGIVRPPAEYDNHKNGAYPVYNEIAKERIKRTG